MTAILIASSLFLCLAAAITWFGYKWYTRPARFYEQVGSAVSVPLPTLDGFEQGARPDLPVRVLEMIGEKVPVSPEDLTIIRRDLIAAGYRSDQAPLVFFGIRALAVAILLMTALGFQGQIDNGTLRIVALVAAAVAGWMGPSFVLDRLITSRHERLRFALPDALDMMVVSVEAGLGLDQAVDHVAREMKVSHKDLSDEFGLVTLEIRAGKRRSDALRNLAERSEQPDLQRLVAILIQTDKFGTSIAESLRTHSDFMRVRRRQEAEERAAKVGVKLVFPIFFFIMPSMFVLAAGPSMLRIAKQFGPMMRQAAGQ